MIHFRYHLISLVAVFLALGIGIVMGSTVIDRAIVDSLENRIKAADNNSRERKEENDVLRKQIEQQDAQDTVLAGHSVRGYLDGQTVFVLRIGEIDNNVLVETRELLAVSNARLGGEILLNSGFLESDKSELAKSLLEREDIKAIMQADTSRNNVVAQSLLAVFAQRAQATVTTPIAQDEVQSLFEEKNAFSERELATSFEPALPVSFVVLVNRKDLNDKNTASFAASLSSTYPITMGFVGNETDSPSRTKSIEKFTSRLPSLMIVDNAESPSGRATLIIAHSRAIAGERSIFGVSSKASSPAPDLQ